jgi:CelD/BcsL family acetyltransferase involved in cellulose biosynthesis
VTPVQATVVHPGELPGSQQQQWRSFTEESALGSPFLSWPFVQVIGRVRDDARVAAFHDGSGIGGFLAFQIGPEDAGLPIGATISDAQAVVAGAGWSFDPRQLVDAAGLAGWSFDHLVVQQTAFVPYYHRRHRSPVAELGAGYDAFIRELRGHSRDLLPQVGRRRRKLEREVGPVVCEWQSSQPESDLRALQQWKSDQYGRVGTWDRFAEPWIAEALEILVRTSHPTCTGVITSLRAGGQLVAAHLGLLGTDRLCWWFPAYNPDFGRYSPGLILLLEIVAEASRRGVPMLDLGRGEHDYKLRVTPRGYEVAEGVVRVGEEVEVAEKPHLVPGARQGASGGVADANA